MQVDYLRQPNGISCATTAILNSIRWAGGTGERAHTENLNYLAQACEQNEEGVHPWTFGRVLKSQGQGLYETEWKIHPKMGRIEGHLQAGGAVLVEFTPKSLREGKDLRHIVLMVGVDPGGYVFQVVNSFKDAPVLEEYDRAEFKWQFLRAKNLDPFYSGWFLTKYGGHPVNTSRRGPRLRV